MQGLDSGCVDWQVCRVFNKPKLCRHLLQKKPVSNWTPWRNIKDRILSRATFQNAQLDDVVDRRGVADMAGPDGIEHAKGKVGKPERLGLLAITIVSAGEQRYRLAKPTKPMKKAQRAEQILIDRWLANAERHLQAPPRRKWTIELKKLVPR